jgi:hypothetical protein
MFRLQALCWINWNKPGGRTAFRRPVKRRRGEFIINSSATYVNSLSTVAVLHQGR